MIFILTSNNTNIKNIKDYNENFIFCLIHSINQYPFRIPKDKFIFDIYYQDGMDIDIESNTEDMEFRYHNLSTITEVLDSISDYLYQIENTERNKDEDIRDEIMFGVCCEYNINNQICKYLINSISNYEDSELIPVNLYQYLKVGSSDKMCQILKRMLHTEFIYPDDPTSYSFALFSAVKGVM